MGAPPINSNPPGVNSLGNIKSCGIGEISDRSSDMVNEGSFLLKSLAVFKKLLTSKLSVMASCASHLSFLLSGGVKTEIKEHLPER